MNNNPPPLVTIGIPTYNRANKYLRQAIESALKQTYSNFEIIVSDNCSTDDTEAVVSSYNDPRIRYFKQDVNIGAINNSNFCLAQARGDYFMQLHDDDIIDPDFLEACMKAANYSTDLGLIRTGTRRIDSDNNILHESLNGASGLSTAEFFRSWFACKTAIYLCSTLFNTEKLKEIGGFRSKHNLFDDAVAIVRLSKFSRVDVAEVKASNRKHGGEESFAVKVGDWIEDSFFLLDTMCEILPAESKIQIRNEGMKFFAFVNYNRANQIKSVPQRVIAYWTVFGKFNCRYLPPRSHFISRIYEFIYDTPFYYGLRSIKRRIYTGQSQK